VSTTNQRCATETAPLPRAADVYMLRALRAAPPVLHEHRKSCNVLRFMIGRMAMAVLMTPTDLPFTSAAVRAWLLPKCCCQSAFITTEGIFSTPTVLAII
jgi:hypothetical protein